MDFLKAEIERKKRQIQEKEVMAGPNKKYFKRGDLAAKEAQEYMSKFGPKKEDIEELEKAKEKPKESKKEIEFPVLPRVEVIRRLRNRHEPILLFGETEDDACKRLRKLEVEEPEAEPSGSTNDYKEAMDKVDKVYMDEILKSQGKDGDNDKSVHDVQLYDSEYTHDDLMNMLNDLDKGDYEHDMKVVHEFIKVLVTMWGQELNARDERIKMSMKGRMETGTYAQTRIYMKPLIRLLKKQALSDDIRDSLVKMVKYTLQRDYILSHEAYMEMAVGNAPWPIGVTNAGIHARPGREKIFSKHVAHVLNDETQRKYIQGLKRLLTKAQQYFPTDPSRSIDYVRKEDAEGSS